MKKVSLFLLTLLMLIIVVPTSVHADEGQKLPDEFLTDGKLLPPEENYMKIYEFDGHYHQYAREYTTQTDDMLMLINEWELLGEEAFIEKYGFYLHDIKVQHDCKLDDGDWHYTPEWDHEEYDYDVLPDYMCLYPTTPGQQNSRILTSGYNIDLYYMDDDGNNWGFFKDVVIWAKGADGEKFRVLDLENHTLYFRSRYIVKYDTYDTNGDAVAQIMFSDWCPETSVGKKGTQQEPVKPEKLAAPVLSNMVLGNAGENDLLWNITWDIPNAVYDAVKYYWIIEDAFEPVIIESQYRVNGGEWIDTVIGNAADVYGGIRNFWTDDAKEKDTVEFRARFYCNADDSKTGEWSNIVSNKAADTNPLATDKPAPTQKGTLENSGAEETKCKVCGICPVQPLGICLFIWIAIIIVVIIVIVVIAKKSNKKKDNKS